MRNNNKKNVEDFFSDTLNVKVSSDKVGLWQVRPVGKGIKLYSEVME